LASDDALRVSRSSGWREFRREIDRSRRHERSFTMLAIPVDPRADDLRTLPAIVSDSVRSVDAVWEDGSNIYIVMPETDRGPAVAAITRITQRIPVLRSRQVRVAMFPDDASTAGALLDLLAAGNETVIGRELVHADPLSDRTVADRTVADVLNGDLLGGSPLTGVPR
jgi:hypothetical protein